MARKIALLGLWPSSQGRFPSKVRTLPNIIFFNQKIQGNRPCPFGLFSRLRSPPTTPHNDPRIPHPSLPPLLLTNSHHPRLASSSHLPPIPFSVTSPPTPRPRTTPHLPSRIYDRQSRIRHPDSQSVQYAGCRGRESQKGFHRSRKSREET